VLVGDAVLDRLPVMPRRMRVEYPGEVCDEMDRDDCPEDIHSLTPFSTVLTFEN
jgi:hypothetical protein